MTTVRLAVGALSPQVRQAFSEHAEALRPALLVSYWYATEELFAARGNGVYYRDIVIDSGAFSAHNSGAEVELGKYIDFCKALRDRYPFVTEYYSLDVIGDWRATRRNTERMWRQGIPAIPCFHYGEPWDLLKGLARDYPKIAIGGCVGRRDKDKFAGDCFARVWPKAMHGFGFGAEKSILMYPWHSVDATNWEIGPCAFGRWNAYGKMSVRGSKQNLRKEVEWYLDLEKRARWRWRKEMGQLKGLEPTVRLATDCRAAGGRRAD